MSIITQEVDTIRWQAQTKLAELGAEQSQAYLVGKINQEAVDKGRTIITLLKRLEWKDFLTNEELENILYCLIEIADINEFPAAPTLPNPTKPTIATGAVGPVGPQGPPGPPGSVGVLVSSDPAFDNITVTPVVGGGVTDYQLGYNPYVAVVAGLTIDNGVVKEVGANNSINFTASFVEGRETITQPADTVITTPGGFTWNSNPQSFVDSGVEESARTTRPYTAQVDDGTTVDSITRNVEIAFPFFDGNSPTFLGSGTEIYTTLNKRLIVPSSSIAVTFNFDTEYGYFAFPEDYNDTNIIIKDFNGFDVTDDFQVDVISVSSTGLVSGGGTDWTKNYKVYRHKNLTTVNNKTFTFENITE